MPLLQGKLNHSWVDPTESKDAEDFLHKYVVMWGFSKAAHELLAMIEQYNQTADYLEKKKKGESSNKFRI